MKRPGSLSSPYARAMCVCASACACVCVSAGCFIFTDSPEIQSLTRDFHFRIFILFPHVCISFQSLNNDDISACLRTSCHPLVGLVISSTICITFYIKSRNPAILVHDWVRTPVARPVFEGERQRSRQFWEVQSSLWISSLLPHLLQLSASREMPPETSSIPQTPHCL